MKKIIFFSSLLVLIFIFALYVVPIRSLAVKKQLIKIFKTELATQINFSDFELYPLRKIIGTNLTVEREDNLFFKAGRYQVSYHPWSLFQGKLEGKIVLWDVDFSLASLIIPQSQAETEGSSKEFFQTVNADLLFDFKKGEFIFNHLIAQGKLLKVQADGKGRPKEKFYRSNLTLSFSKELANDIAKLLGESMLCRPVFKEGPEGWINLRLILKKESDHFSLDIFPYSKP